MTSVLGHIKEAVTGTPAALDVERIRQDFPMLKHQVHGRPLVWLDNSATTHKPQCVIDRITAFYTEECAKILSDHTMGKQATQTFEQSRTTLANHLNAASSDEIIFVRGATEALNLAAYGFIHSVLQAGDEVILTQIEHHSNIVPWLIGSEHVGYTIKVAPIDQQGNLDLNQLEAMLTDRTKVIGVTHVSNVFGTIYPVKEIAEMAHRRGIAVVVDGAQSSPHLPVDVQGLGCDFFLGSGHKMYGPLGVGFIYGRREWLERLEPAEGGSEMSESVTFTDWKPKPLPYKFEAGTPATGDAIAFATGLDYLNNLGMKSIEQYEKELVNYTTERLSQIDRVQGLGAGTDRVSIVSFTVDGMKPEQVGQYLDKKASIATRWGTLSAQPLMEFLQIPGAVRVSFSFYNTRAEADLLVDTVEQCIKAKG